MALFVLLLCPFDISVGIWAFVIGLGQISSFLSLFQLYVIRALIYCTFLQRNITDERRITKRMRSYRSMCKGKESIIGSISEKNMRGQFQMSEKQHLLYCSIYKSGSTFWKRFLQVMDSGNISNQVQHATQERG